MYRLLYGIDQETAKPIAVCDTMEQATVRLHRFLDERNIQSYYTRMWTQEDGITVIDYGSWSRFFYIVPVNDKTVAETMRERSDA